MGDISHEPSMEDILSSIKRIIADDAEKSLSEPRARRPVVRPVPDEIAPEPKAAEPEAEDVFELTERAPHEEEPVILSETAARASRSALDSLSTMIVKPGVTGSDTLEGMVREMLRPMLKDWLDANLPQLVEGLVAKEIARITGKTLI